LQNEYPAARIEKLSSLFQEMQDLPAAFQVFEKIAHEDNVVSPAQVGFRKIRGVNKFNARSAPFHRRGVRVHGDPAAGSDKVDEIAKPGSDIENRVIGANPALKEVIDEHPPHGFHGLAVAGVEPVSVHGGQVRTVWSIAHRRTMA
jgi:hypothetical protein